MTVWIIEPRDSLIVRDGRPFGPTPGARARSLPFPFSSTVAGSLRALWWTQSGRTFAENPLTAEEQAALLSVQMKGPLLVEYTAADADVAWLLPAPADALLLKESTGAGGTQLHQLTPLQLPEGAATDFGATLLPVGLEKPNPNKPDADSPLYWRWPYLQSWLLAPAQMQTKHAELFEQHAIQQWLLGSKGPMGESRTHLRVLPQNLTAQEGFLFQTSGLEFRQASRPPGIAASLTQLHQLALAVATDVDLPSGPAFLGGERRAVQWRKTELSLPPCPPEIRSAIIRDKHCRLLLLTPGYFDQGDRPTWLLEGLAQGKAMLQAMAVQRPQIVSGWDYAEKRPKATRRLAPAGSVYFLALEGDETTMGQFIDQVWMQCISDNEQARRDGFGLAVLGTWDGKPKLLQKER